LRGIFPLRRKRERALFEGGDEEPDLKKAGRHVHRSIFLMRPMRSYDLRQREGAGQARPQKSREAGAP
jgi:hypothetical protein